MRPMYCFHLWQQMQIKEALEDMDVISRNAWIQDDIIMAGLWYCLLYQTDDELSGFTQNVIKPQLAPRGRIIFIWSGFPNPDASLNLVHTVVSMGVWHAKVPLSRTQNISQLRGGCPRAVPDLWPPGCRRQRKEMFNEGFGWAQKDSLGEPLSHPCATHKTKSEKTFRIGFATCWIWEPGMKGAFCRLGANEAILFSSQISPQKRDKHHKHPSYSSRHIAWPNRK